MKKISILIACLVLTSGVFGMSLAMPKIVEADETTFEIKENITDLYESHGSISVQGTASIESRPDLLVIILSIKALDENSADKASDKVSVILDQIINSLIGLGISKEDIGSTSYTINQKYEWTYYENGNRQERIFKGYEAVNKLRVEIRDFDKGGKIIDAAADADALVDNINFELSKEKRNNLKIQAMEIAAKDAKIKAETIISALGEELGHVSSVNLNDYYYQPYKYWDREVYSLDKANGESAAPPTVLLPTDLTVSCTINVVFDII